MDGPDKAGDDRTFTVDCNADGASRLRAAVNEKLKELMGDYTDDTLVDYIVVLLRNGKSKDEARRELKVFLGENSVSFVSWLWEHLSSNLHLYVQSKESFPVKVAKLSSINEMSGTHDSQAAHVSGNVNDSEDKRENLTKLTRSRHNKGWKGLGQETKLFPLGSIVTEIFHPEMRTHDQPNLVRRSRSPVAPVHKKRSRQDGQQLKRDTGSRPLIGAPRRLLQFAVRDAVRTGQQLSSGSEPVFKRHCSAVSMSTTNSILDGRAQRMRSVGRMPGLSIALKAAAEAAEDVAKARYSVSVFDRLQQGIGKAEPINQSSDTRISVLEDGECEDFDQIPGSNDVSYCQSTYDGESTGNITMFDRDSGFASDSVSDDDRYDGGGIVRQSLDLTNGASSANEGLKVQYIVAQDANEIARKTRLMDPDPSASAAGKASSKIVNISVNLNTRKPSGYQALKDVIEEEDQMDVEENEMRAKKPNVRHQKENETTMARNVNEIAHSDVQKEPQKTVASTSGSYTTNPSEDVDSRTVFVSNVHFGATKDTLSRHFNKFGEVLKVIILTDAPTGQPKGSAYVEFLRKESAELALSLNGTSFMSRVLKVVRRSYMRHEAGSIYGWPHTSRVSRLSRMVFPHAAALAGTFRARIPIKPGARSLQWKRGAIGVEGERGNSMKHTYVRSEARADVDSAPS